ncbi:HAD family hydrolase [Aggregicoccus sp. 17bor-14]|uniref:HAD family hydrolase n=1 Tax=Myxococcaceae TaxID=31 RepID=UPI00129C5800|nr:MULTISPECIES: HAD family hydrolase [Myxococcaceae]MBF5046094.1 HAD family hydrolase [Simulacricoccus sp. 17bor-14]MRI91823.1 HAD family hydrolase [Aggregicoccus sp. 17bor-14]
MIRLVVTDMDGTLYSWVDYIVPAVEALVEAVQRATGWPRLRVVQSLKAVYAKYESNEYPFALQESSLYREFCEFGSFDKLVIEPAREAFALARRKYLRPYPGVVATLEALHARGLPVVALTDAPRNPAEYRVRTLGFDRYLQGLYTLPGFAFPASEEGEALVAAAIQQREARGAYRAQCVVEELPRDWEKPNPRGLLRICERFGVPPEQTLYVGDSLRKDVAVAKAVGALDCWAEYGTYVSGEYRERLDIISAPAVTRRHAAGVLEGGEARREEPATHALSNFAQLLRIIEGKAL